MFGLGALLAVGGACTVSEAPVHAEKAKPGDEKILAMVGDIPVTVDEVETAVAGANSKTPCA